MNKQFQVLFFRNLKEKQIILKMSESLTNKQHAIFCFEFFFFFFYIGPMQLFHETPSVFRIIIYLSSLKSLCVYMFVFAVFSEVRVKSVIVLCIEVNYTAFG